ncbi:unnamed protein product [Orchesella dallaii]|uniref:Gustatory receptor n=1 Tax=Orchesella dallaii TaxID=48710 RepID=A0ABP1Q2T4_9HEXA
MALEIFFWVLNKLESGKMIEPEQSASLNMFISCKNSSNGSKPIDKKTRDIISDFGDPFITNTIINGGKWIFFSNRLVVYWPFSIKSTSSNHISHKYLSFQLPTVGLFVTVSYLLLNVLYLFHYFFVKFQDDVRDFHPFDLILITTWDCMIMFGVIGYRIYGILRLSKFHSFWNNIVNLVTQITEISSKRETKEKFHQLNRWGLKWIVIFTLMGLLNATAVFYNYVCVTYELPQVVITFEYLESVIMMHNSSAFLLVFFLKIMTHGFTTCHRKLEKMSEENFRENYSDKSCDYETIELSSVFNIIHKLEECVSSFNSTFVFTLLLEAVFSFLQVMFALYFVHVVDPVSNAAYWINMAMPIFMYSACLINLCAASSQLTVECEEMVSKFQELPVSTLSVKDSHKVHLLVSRLSVNPPAIQVSQLFYIRESLLASALNTLATYFIVLVQMRQFTKTADGNIEALNQTHLNENS